MNALLALRRFIAVNQGPENVAEIRSYIAEHIAEVAHDLGVTNEAITETLANVEDDAVLATKMLAIVKRAEARARDIKKDGRVNSAQIAANALASRATFDGERFQLDLPALLASVLTKRTDRIVFSSEEFAVAVYQAPLFDLAKLKLRDLTGFVDSKGLHVRWTTGGLNLRSQVDPRAGRVVMNLSRKPKAEAA